MILFGVLAAGAAAASPAPATRLTPAAAVEGHCGAWNTPDRAERERLLRRVLASDAVYSDPTPTLVRGRAALSNAITSFHREYPGASFRCSAPQIHHRSMRVTWILMRADGTVETEGMDFYELAPDGRIRSVTGFFGPAPRLDASR